MKARLPMRSGLARPLDFDYRSNRFVAIVTVLAGLSALAWRLGTGSGDAYLWSFQIAGGVFLAWAIGRELDPDDDHSATRASLIILPLMALGSPSLAASGAALMGVRVAVRTTGLSPQPIDGPVLIAAAAYLGTQPETWPALLVLLGAVGADPFVHPPGPTGERWLGVLMALAAAIGATMLSAGPSWMPPTRPEWLVFGLSTALAVFISVTTRPPRSRSDSDDEILSQGRLRFGRALTAAAALLGVVLLGGPAVSGMTPVFAAILGSAAAFVTRFGWRNRRIR